MKPGLKLYQGHPAGRDLREMTQDDLRKAGHRLQALRTRCLDCCGYQEKEMALCSAVDCPFWPFRMGTDPLRKPASEARREAARRVMSNLNARRRKGLVLNLPPALLPRYCTALGGGMASGPDYYGPRRSGPRTGTAPGGRDGRGQTGEQCQQRPISDDGGVNIAPGGASEERTG